MKAKLEVESVQVQAQREIALLVKRVEEAAAAAAAEAEATEAVCDESTPTPSGDAQVTPCPICGWGVRKYMRCERCSKKGAAMGAVAPKKQSLKEALRSSIFGGAV